ncbi:MAG TPA: N-acetyl-gamma-glutamyl-phosphate reductase [Dehalococcoidia bacterium]|nr:N-acetyl-gamma-glutamyl-phosphate reductase [Dehalococcoidia bacterium]
MIRVGILNVTGYAGAELARLVHSHPEATLVAATGRSGAGQKLEEVFPHLWPLGLTVTDEIGESVDLVFSALPHAASAESLLPFLREGAKVIDISADFRLRDSAVYERHYGRPHPAPELLSGAAYGLPEVTREPGDGTPLVANPGCYAAGALLAAAPGVASGALQPGLVIDGKSGVSGAGRALAQDYHYAEANDNLSAYGLAGQGHRHRPEIDQELSRLSPNHSPVTFVPHLVPMTRGILTTLYAQRNEGSGSLKGIYEEYYEGSSFVRVVDEPPSTRQVAGTNNCLIFIREDDPSGRSIVISVIDNLGRGAAGQAIQNMNRVFSLPETTGLDSIALYP